MLTTHQTILQVGAVCGMTLPTPPEVKHSARESFQSVPHNLEQGFETLGYYCSNKQQIVIYRTKCGQFAQELNVSPDAVRDVVLIHELAHAVHHTGAYDGIDCWTSFDKQPAGLIERLAQETTLLVIQKDYRNLFEVFKKMSDRSPPIYQTWSERWQEYQRDPDSFVRDLLVTSGRRSPLPPDVIDIEYPDS